MSDKIIVSDAPDAARAFTNAALFAGKDTYRPILTEVELTAEANELTLVATDRYSLYRERLVVEYDGPKRVFRVTAKELGLVSGACKGAKYMPLVLVVDDREVSATVGGQTFTFRCAEGEYPNYETLFSGHGNEPTTMVALGAPQLARLGKIKHDSAGKVGPTLRLEPDGALKAVKFTVGTTIDGLVMPIRV